MQAPEYSGVTNRGATELSSAFTAWPLEHTGTRGRTKAPAHSAHFTFSSAEATANSADPMCFYIRANQEVKNPRRPCRMEERENKINSETRGGVLEGRKRMLEQ